RVVAGLAALAASLVAPYAVAQGNYRATPAGGRSALMGGTGIAMGRDGAAAFLNPATIADIEDTTLAFSVNFYSFSRTRLTNFFQPRGAEQAVFGDLRLPEATLRESRFDALPSTLCLFLTLKEGRIEEDRKRPDDVGPTRGRQKIAACLGTLERQELSDTAL